MDGYSKTIERNSKRPETLNLNGSRVKRRNTVHFSTRRPRLYSAPLKRAQSALNTQSRWIRVKYKMLEIRMTPSQEIAGQTTSSIAGVSCIDERISELPMAKLNERPKSVNVMFGSGEIRSYMQERPKIAV